MTQPKLTPSQEAREAVASANPLVGEAIRAGEYDDDSLVQAFARFEQAIRKDEAEKCAAEADEFAASSKPLRDAVDVARHDEAKLIAAAIRARHAEGGEK